MCNGDCNQGRNCDCFGSVFVKDVKPAYSSKPAKIVIAMMFISIVATLVAAILHS